MQLMLLQVLKVKVDLIGYLTVNSVFTKRTVDCCLADLVDKVGDAKNGAAIQETLSCLAECTSLEYITMQVSIDQLFHELLNLFSVSLHVSSAVCNIMHMVYVVNISLLVHY